MQLRKFSGQRFAEVPHSVIPVLIRDLAFDLIQGRVLALGRRAKDCSSQRSASLRTGMLKQVLDDVCLTKNEQPGRVSWNEEPFYSKGRWGH